MRALTVEQDSTVIMMFIRPIPRIMMPDTIQYSALGADTRYGNTYGTPITIRYCRLIPKSQLKFSQQAETIDFSDMLFIDPRTSRQDLNGADVTLTITPKEKDKITLNGIDYMVINANALYVDNGTLHHYECTLNRM